MTVSTTTSRWEYDGDGVSTAFPYDNRIFAATDMKVYVGGVLQVSGYSVTGVDQPAGGTVVFASAPPAGTKNVILVRDVPALQPTAYPPNDRFPSAAHERALDRLTILIQQLLLSFQRTIRLQDSDLTPGLLVPSLLDRAGKWAAWDEDGNLIPAAGAAGVPVTSFAATLLDDTTAAAARATLGNSVLGDQIVTASTSDAVTTVLVPTAPLSGAVARSLRDRLADNVNLLDVGGALDGGTADEATFESAAAQAVAAGKLVVAPRRAARFDVAAIIPPETDIRGPGDPRNLLLNGNFHTWERTLVRGTTTFNVPPPTFGDPNTYDGTGGLRIYGPDLWFGKVWGLYGSATLYRQAKTAAEVELSPGSEWCLRWNVTSLVPPAAFVKTIMNLTPANVATVTVTSPGHGFANGTWVWIEGATYSGGLGSLEAQPNEASFQISNVTTDTFDITLDSPDAGFVAWTAFGVANNDPDNTGYQHVYDASLVGATPPRRRWIRNGTSSHELSTRIPIPRGKSGLHTVRVRCRLNSGSASRLLLRLYQDFGTGGSPSATTSTTLPAMVPTGEIEDHLMVVNLPDLDGKTYGSTPKTAYMQLSITADPDTFSLDVFSVSVHEGLISPPNPHRHEGEELPTLRRFYQPLRSGVLTPTTAGRFYGPDVSFSPPMWGAPTVSRVSDVAISNFNTPTVQSITSRGFRVSAEASATANVGYVSTLFEAEYSIPT